MPYFDLNDVTTAFASNIFANANIEALQERKIETIRKNMEDFSRKEDKGAHLARIAQSIVAHPPDSNFKLMVSSPSFKNCPVTVNDVTNARTIFGPDQPGLAGRSTIQKPQRVVPEYMGIPRVLYERHKYVTLKAEVMFVNGIAFLVSLLRGD